jgi:AmmeMemoRadiSam system protein B
LDLVKSKLGNADAAKFMEHRYDHEREHSIELHIPWIQHCLGPNDGGEHIPVFAALIHDPCVNSGESYDGAGLALDPFIEALTAALAEIGGKTLIISSADLSHVGPAFGDQQTLIGEDQPVVEARNKVVQHDREMLKLIMENKPDDLVASMSWQQNPTRWCSVGNIVCAMKVAKPTSVTMLNYGAAIDQQGMTMVSHAAIAMN